VGAVVKSTGAMGAGGVNGGLGLTRAQIESFKRGEYREGLYQQWGEYMDPREEEGPVERKEGFTDREGSWEGLTEREEGFTVICITIVKTRVFSEPHF
jgi:hypothetical protein